LYHITLTTISLEAKFSKQELSELMPSLAPKVKWYPEESLVWVENFLRRQTKSTKFIIAAIKSLDRDSVPEEIRNDFELYNDELLHEVAPSEHISPTKRECVIIRDDFHCQYCGTEITDAADYEADHIIPVARGGKENYLNLVTACRRCNQKKLDKTPLEAGLPMPIAKPFHGAQATYILKTNPGIRKKWLQLFPDRYKVVESMLNNIEPISTNINQRQPGILTRASKAAAVSGPGSVSGSGTKEKEIGKGEGGTELATKGIPRSRTEAEETLCEGDRVEVPPKGEGDSHRAEGDEAVISVWRSVKGFDLSDANARELVARMRTEFADMDILAESKAWSAGKLSDPLKRGSKPASQLWNWMRLARKFAQERSEHGQQESRTGRRAQAHTRDPLQAFRDGGGTVILSGEEAEAGNEGPGV
jgi:hypothetical protein